MLYIIGIGLNDYKDISLRSFEILKEADVIYEECYTCIQNSSFKSIESIINKKIIPANRKIVEEEDRILEDAMTKIVVFLVSGTPFFATTHIDIFVRAKKLKIETKVIHNISIMNVKGCYGLYSYNFGKTISIPYFEDNYKPISFYDNIYVNWINKMHTLCLLDIRTDENRFMTINEAISQLLYAEEVTKKGIFTKELKILAICRFATDQEKIFYDTVENLSKMDFGPPLHSLIIPGELSIIEKEFLEEAMF